MFISTKSAMFFYIFRLSIVYSIIYQERMVGRVTMDWAIRDSISGRGMIFSSLKCPDRLTGYLASCSLGNRNKADRPPPPSVHVKNEWSYISTTPTPSLRDRERPFFLYEWRISQTYTAARIRRRFSKIFLVLKSVFYIVNWLMYGCSKRTRIPFMSTKTSKLCNLPYFISSNLIMHSSRYFFWQSIMKLIAHWIQKWQNLRL